jgi:putative FmdB family regulatory protein
MPLIGFKCSECGHSDSKLVKPKDLASVKNTGACPVCKNEESYERQLGAPASKSTFSVDQPGMQKAVELNMDVIQDNITRSKKEPNRDP